MKTAHYPGSSRCLPVARAAACLLLGLSLLLAGCGSERGMVRKPAPPTSTKAWPTVQVSDPASVNSVLMRALGLVGTPYRYGGNTPDSGFDCSGLVTYVYRDMLDLRLPRTSRELAQVQGPKIAENRLAPADLVFFGTRGNVSHVGIYVGEGRFVHAPSTGGTVRLDHLDGPYWRDHYTGARRVVN
ncbi:C40 family peptidase [Pseudoxanthomonas sp.]|uniref:C40 family peptidase n=1 Tax=Pseudoxanthomonas sp. TaxID=1871049 RepID=UPI00260BE1D1|nr:C40 family peptidase [Pseudoxanthomonas sp.]WDS36383.1 MAG: C40 family peptidase [Pseudoxanthomonas sp.]